VCLFIPLFRVYAIDANCCVSAMSSDGIQNLGPNVTLITLNTEGKPGALGPGVLNICFCSPVFLRQKKNVGFRSPDRP
jgi:hypothetical protein